MPKLPIINAHTHIFTEKNIPPLIAKTFVPWPFYYLLHIGLVFKLFKGYKWIKRRVERFGKFQTRVISNIRSTPIIRSIDYIVSIFITFNVIVLLLKWSEAIKKTVIVGGCLSAIESSYADYFVLERFETIGKVAIVVLLLFLYPGISKLLFSLAKKLFSPLQYIPSSRTMAFIQRYLTIAEFAKYKSQKGIFDRLIKMYEPGSKMVVLPMDLEYMKAWQPTQNYIEQINDLTASFEKGHKNIEYLIPFLFVDPRRIRDKKKNKIRDEKNKKDIPFFDWKYEKKEVDGKFINWVSLKECFIKNCLEGDSEIGELCGYYKGIKIYPAVGYYPFDEDLLPLWVYCVQHNIPITTHCIEGTIFYRGTMENKWMHHPVFENNDGTKLNTCVRTNYDLQINFTHPLNYLVLLEEYYLTKFVSACSDKIQQLFGFNKANNTIAINLKALKVNLAHYGGKEEWKKYLAADRQDLSVELIENPKRGAELVKVQKPKNDTEAALYSKPAWIWNNNFEWFSIISSMMLQYPNVYSDISYILHSEEVKPLLYQVLKSNTKLSKKILYGTDFFVVRNHKSEKELYGELLACIGVESMDLISRENPDKFLNSY